jgi:hypothetical protein
MERFAESLTHEVRLRDHAGGLSPGALIASLLAGRIARGAPDDVESAAADVVGLDPHEAVLRRRVPREQR